MSTDRTDVPPGRAAQSLWCDRNWHDGACCPGSIRQWHLQRDLLPPEPATLETRRSNGLGAAMIAVPLVVLAYALLAFAAVEIFQWITR
jgi:hypothetical protein